MYVIQIPSYACSTRCCCDEHVFLIEKDVWELMGTYFKVLNERNESNLMLDCEMQHYECVFDIWSQSKIIETQPHESVIAFVKKIERKEMLNFFKKVCNIRCATTKAKTTLPGASFPPPPVDAPAFVDALAPAVTATERWVTVDVYKALASTTKVCGYMALRGEHKLKVCCMPATYLDENPLKYRCEQCREKVGVLAKYL